MSDSHALKILHADVMRDASTLREAFASAAPFPHVVIDNFLEPAFAASLLAAFPAFERGNAVGEDGKLGSKSTLASVRRLGPAYQQLDEAIKQIDAQRADLGAVQNRFDNTINNLKNIGENVSAARGRIEDTDFAAETANLTKNQVLQQAGTAILAQANQLPQSVLSLLR